ncbi:MAG: DUF3667 domain-containing protein [Ferruginibacter sp.]
MEGNNTCKNCGFNFTGYYCNRCGEKVYTEVDKSLTHLIQGTFHFITHLEGTFLNALKTFLTQPGKFSFDYCRGIRKKYYKPVSFFMMLVILYLIFPRFQGLNMKLSTYADKYYGFYLDICSGYKSKNE